MFVDTNVLVNSRAVGSPHHEIARDLLANVRQGPEPLRISRQVIREYLAVVTRPQIWSAPLTPDEALHDVNWLLNDFEILEDGIAATGWLLTLFREISMGGRQIHDANIVATMLAHGERRLLTFNGSDFRRFGNRIDLFPG